ncbi:MAG: hypothetical protein H0U67_14135 [Gemmatimonadetes bacterium]|nr:hypothetical protein [Gemmatimonadota bacterium]
MSELHFRTLHIRRMPGVDDGGFTLDGLGSGINLIHGPNASGKTTSARAMQAIFWPRMTGAERAWLAAEFTVDGVLWTAKIDGGHAEYQRDGIPADPLALPSESERDRYCLALHELLLSEDREFARKIQQESAGGYDLRAAGGALNPRPGPSRSSAETKALEEAKRAHQLALQNQQQIRADEDSLVNLRSRREEASLAVVRMATLKDASEHAKVKDEESDARIALEAFPYWMSRVRGDELHRLSDLRKRSAALKSEVQTAQGEADRASSAIEVAMIPEGQVSGETIPGLRADLEALEDADHELHTLKQQRAALMKREDEERARIGLAIGEQQLLDLDHPAMRDLGEFARHAAEVRAEQRRLEVERDGIGYFERGEDPELLADGIRQLQRWLREPTPAAPDQRSRTFGLLAAGLLAVSGLVFALLNPLALLATLLGVILIWVLLARQTPAEDARRVHQRIYEGLELSLPAAWEPPEVEGVLRELIARNHEAVGSRDRRRRHAEVSAQLQAHEPKMHELEEERAEIESQLGVAPGLDEGHLHWLASRICRWQDAKSERAEAEASLDTATACAQRLRDDLRSRLAPFCAAALASTGQISGAIKDLDQRQRALAEAQRDLASAGATIERARKDLGSCDSDQRSIFESLGLTGEDEAMLTFWSARLNDYRKAAELAQSRRTLLAQAKQRLESHGADEEFFTATIETLELRLDQARATADSLSQIDEEILRIGIRVDAARKSHDVEAALERAERAEQALRDARGRDVEGVIASVLIDHVDRETRDQHLPAVFRGASDLFAKLTHGRYRLQFDTEDGARFLAFDTRDREGRTLDQLSSGTRVQLLLAVRIAFVESQEQGLKLPLVFDEVLGNSDDERAAAIIEAAIELSRHGRQIFYFTAQQDEVGKWRAIVDRHQDVAFHEVDLRAARSIAHSGNFTIPATAFEPAPRAPHPNGDDHAAYGMRLRVPALDPVTTHVGALHLWYLVDSPQVCFRLLEIGPERWGELERFLDSGGHRLLDDGLAARLPILARAAELFLHDIRIGVGKLVDRAALTESAAVSLAFIDRVAEFSDSLQGDAALLVEGLKNRKVQRFQLAQAEAMEAFLEENGYLDRRERLAPEEIRSRVIAALATEVSEGRVSLDDLQSLLRRLEAGVKPIPAQPLTLL